MNSQFFTSPYHMEGCSPTQGTYKLMTWEVFIKLC